MEKNNLPAVEPANDLVQLSALSEAVQGLLIPIADSQKFVAQETTKQTEIISNAKLKMFWGICVLVGLIIVLAGMALYLGKENITEKVLIAIVSFLGGLGFSRISKNS